MPRNGKKLRCVGPGATGLCNSGSSCYMNVIIQVISQTYFLYNFFVNNITFSGDNSNTALGPLSLELQHVLCRIWNGEYVYFLPKRLYRTIKQLMPQYSPYDESDSHEFFISFNTVLHNELKQPVSSNSAKDIVVHDGFNSIIRHTFYGQHTVEIKCNHCSYRRNTVEAFDNLSLAIPDYRATLEELLVRYYASQTLEDYQCPQCKSLKCCTTTTRISKVPKVLVICLKRFTVQFIDGEYNQMKNTNKVDYPLVELKFGENMYHLYAVVIHTAHEDDMDCGHYVAFCKNLYDGNWWKYNDDRVREASKHEVYQPKQSYLLFYELSSEMKKCRSAH